MQSRTLILTKCYGDKQMAAETTGNRQLHFTPLDRGHTPSPGVDKHIIPLAMKTCRDIGDKCVGVLHNCFRGISYVDCSIYTGRITPGNSMYLHGKREQVFQVLSGHGTFNIYAKEQKDRPNTPFLYLVRVLTDSQRCCDSPMKFPGEGSYF